MLTFTVERYGEEIALYTEDVGTGETRRIGTLVSEEAVRSFWDVINGGKLVAREQGRSGI
jgi:hypothetical protein